MNTEKLFHRDFSLMVIGQIASLFGNSILRFALSLYVLDLTGSAAAFGTILALSMIPTILLSPVGGILADRASRKWIMVALDFTTAALIFCFFLILHVTPSLAAIAGLMILLSIIQSFYQPSVQSSIPSLASKDNLMKANGIVVQVNAFSTLLGPILGGFLYAFFGLYPILCASILCFFFSAVMELFLHIPFTRSEKSKNLFRSAGADFKNALHFLAKDNPALLRLLVVLAGLNLFLSSMIMVGLPFLIKIFLGLGGQYYGFAEGALAAGSILGGCLVGLFEKKVPFQQSHRFLFAAALMLLPLGLSVVSNQMPFISYGVILACVIGCMLFACLFNIFAQTFLQQQTPPHLLGKVMSFVSSIAICSIPLGQALYGVLFDYLNNAAYMVVFVAAVCSIVITLGAKKVFSRIPEAAAKEHDADTREDSLENSF